MRKLVSLACLLISISVVAQKTFSDEAQDLLWIQEAANIPTSEYIALYDLYNSTHGENWAWESASGSQWNFTGPHNPCSEAWAGVRCSNSTDDSCSVTGIDLQNMNLTGTLPWSIGYLSNLTTLLLDGNYVSGTIPTEICLLAALERFDVYHNELEGTLLECFGSMTSLVELTLVNNMLSHSIPSSFGGMSSIQLLDLHMNSLNGTLPTSLACLSSLRSLWLYSNALSGPIGLSFVSPYWTDLRILEIDTNLFTAELPSYIGNWSSLTMFTAGWNSINGSIPISVQAMTNLEELALHSNQLTSSIPTELANFKYLMSLSFESNRLSGPIPSELCTNLLLNTVGLDENFLTGHIPDCMWDSKLTGLNVTGNYLWGSIPSIMSLDKAFTLYLSYNMFSGVLPTSMQSLSMIQFLDFSYNYFSGQLRLSDLTTLQYLYLNHNLFTGNLDLSLDDNLDRNLSSVDVSNNQLTGTLAPSLFGFSALEDFNAINNCFSGSIPAEICSASSLSVIMMDGLSTNCKTPLLPLLWKYTKAYVLAVRVSLDTDVFKCIMELPRLKAFYYAGNSAKLLFPAAANISSKAFTTLSMTHNQLEGTVPSYIFDNRWNLLDLSYNRLTGLLSPVSMMSNQSSVSLEVNRFSGVIPGSYQGLEIVNILRDNMFSCSFYSDRGLPENDPSRGNYSCGSAHINETLVAWGVVFVIVLFLVHYFYGINVIVDRVNKLVSFTEAETSSNFYQHSVQRINASLDIFEKQQADIRRNVFLCLCSIVFVLLPIYCGLSTVYSIFTYKYGWYPTALFNSGKAPAFIDITLLSLFLVQVHILFRDEGDAPNSVPHSASIISSAAETMRNGMETLTKRYFLNWRIILVLLLDIMLIGSVTFGYIVLTMHGSHQEVMAGSIFVALTKALWNGPILRALIDMLRANEWKQSQSCSISMSPSEKKHVIGQSRPATESIDEENCIPSSDNVNVGIEMAHTESTHPRPQETESITDKSNNPMHDETEAKLPHHETIKTRMRTTGGKAALTGAESSTERVHTVSSTLSDRTGIERLPVSRESVESWGKHLSLARSTLMLLDFDDTYHRDFRFRLYLGFLNTIILPCVATALLSTSCFYELLVPSKAIPASYTNTVCDAALASSSCELSFVANQTDIMVGSTVTVSTITTTPFVYSYQCASIVLKSFAPVFISSSIITGFLFPVFAFLVDDILLVYHDQLSTSYVRLHKGLEAFHFLISVTKSNSRTMRMAKDLKDQKYDSIHLHGSVFRKDVHIGLIANGIAVLVTFGVLMPPVAVVVGITIMTQTFVANRKVGELMRIFEKHGQLLGIDLMGRECASLPQTISTSIMPISIIAGGFWCFLAFDQYGDAVGYQRAILIFLWLLYPLCIPGVVMYLRSRLAGSRNDAKDTRMAEVELQYCEILKQHGKM
jgi:Leucine-rich repeat (LRR) protein